MNKTPKNVMSADNQQGRLEIMKRRFHPEYVVGFVDGEGSFHIAIYKDVRMKIGVKFIPEFHVSQRVSSRSVLEMLVDFFGCGYLKENHATNPRDVTHVFVVRDRQDLLEKIIPFFKKHRLQTEKRHDFDRFARIVQLMDDGKHRNPTGAKKILALAYQMNQNGKYRQKRHDIF